MDEEDEENGDEDEENEDEENKDGEGDEGDEDDEEMDGESIKQLVEAKKKRLQEEEEENDPSLKVLGKVLLCAYLADKCSRSFGFGRDRLGLEDDRYALCLLFWQH